MIDYKEVTIVLKDLPNGSVDVLTDLNTYTNIGFTKAEMIASLVIEQLRSFPQQVE